MAHVRIGLHNSALWARDYYFSSTYRHATPLTLWRTFFNQWAGREYDSIFAAGFLRSVLDFKESGGDSNMRRRHSVDWWLTFLDGAEKCRVTVGAKYRTMYDVYSWLFDQAAPSMAMVNRRFGNVGMATLVESGGERLTKRHLAILRT